MLLFLRGVVVGDTMIGRLIRWLEGCYGHFQGKSWKSSGSIKKNSCQNWFLLELGFVNFSRGTVSSKLTLRDNLQLQWMAMDMRDTYPYKHGFSSCLRAESESHIARNIKFGLTNKLASLRV